MFRGQVQNDKNVKNAYLPVHSEKIGIDINITEGKTGDTQANPKQANHLASVGKLFTFTVICMLYDKGLLKFEDSISQYLDAEFMDGLHVYKGNFNVSGIVPGTSIHKGIVVCNAVYLYGIANVCLCRFCRRHSIFKHH